MKLFRSCITFFSFYIILLSLCMCSEPTNNEEGISLEKAKTIVLNEVLQGDTTGCDVFVLPTQLNSGDSVFAGINFKVNSHLVSEKSWFFFIDDAPDAYWTHPCRYIFISVKSGEFLSIDEEWPPYQMELDLISF